jgi:hypothetical protein
MKAIGILKEFVRLVEEEGLNLEELCEQTDLIKEAIKELEEIEEKVKVQDDLLKQYVKKDFDGVVAEIAYLCTDCDNYLKDRTIFYYGQKVMLCNFCKINNGCYFKKKEEK